MNDDHDDLRRALHDAADGVHPHDDALARIRARTRPDQEATVKRWTLPALTAAAAVALVFGGVAWLARQQQEPPAAGTDRTGDVQVTEQPQAERTREPGRTITVPVYYVGDTLNGPRLFREEHTLDEVRGTDLAAAVQEAVGRPPQDPDYLAWRPSDGITTRATTDDQTITIDLSEQLGRPTGMDDATASMMLQALAATANATLGSSTTLPVRFTVAGRPVDTVLGTPTTEPLELGSPDSVSSPVQISLPTQGQTVQSGFQVEGMAATPEANVVWQLRQGDEVVKEGFTTAAQCCTLSPYMFQLDAPPGDYTLVVSDTDDSGGEGVRVTEDTRDITIG